MNSQHKLTSKVEVEPNIFELTYEVYNSGSCQCFKDCDCYKKKGEFMGKYIRYSNSLVKNAGGKERTYSTLKGCKDSIKAYKNKIH